MIISNVKIIAKFIKSKLARFLSTRSISGDFIVYTYNYKITVTGNYID